MSGEYCPSAKWHHYAATGCCFYVSTTKAVWKDADMACRNMGGYLASIKNHAQMSFVYSILSVLLEKLCYCRPELSMCPLCVTRSNPTHQLTDPTQPNLLQVAKICTQPNTTNNGAYSLVVTYFYTQNLSCTFRQPNINLFVFFTDLYTYYNSAVMSLKTSSSVVTSNLPAGCSQISSNRALNALT